MKKQLGVMLLTSVLAAWCTTSAAQPVYRCGDSYSQQPCAGGKEVAVQDARSGSQQSQTRDAAQRDAKAADAMEKARVKEEAKPVQVFLPPAKVTETNELENRNVMVPSKATKPAYFTAVSPRKPGEPAKKKKKTKKTA
jgi:hypothetical protein